MITIECLNCKEIPRHACKGCDSRREKRYIKGILVKYSNAPDIAIREGYDILVKGNAVYLEDYKGTRAKIAVSETSYTSIWNLLEALSDCRCGSSGGSGGVVSTEKSVQGDGTVGDKIQLVNDSTSPGASRYYGTNSSSTKGYHVLPDDEIETEMSVQGDGTTGDKVKLINDADVPGNSKYYGTDGGGAKGFFDLPSSGSKYDAGDGCRVWASATGVTYSKIAGTGTLTIPAGVVVFGITIKGVTADLSGNNINFVINGIDTGMSTANVKLPSFDVINAAAILGGGPSDGLPFIFDEGSTPQRQIVGISSTSFTLKIISLNVFSEWYVTINF